MAFRTDSIGVDKFWHFWFGFWVSLVSMAFIGVIGLWVTVLVGAGKELVYDKWMKKGTPDFWDFLFTILPAIGLYIATLINY